MYYDIYLIDLFILWKIICIQVCVWYTICTTGKASGVNLNLLQEPITSQPHYRNSNNKTIFQFRELGVNISNDIDITSEENVKVQTVLCIYNHARDYSHFCLTSATKNCRKVSVIGALSPITLLMRPRLRNKKIWSKEAKKGAEEGRTRSI